MHHTLYIINRLPWQYDDEDLVTLCNSCHENLHNNENVKVYSEQKFNILKFGFCDRCGGKGYFKEYRKIQGGLCFKCKGFGYNIPLINIKEIIKNQKPSENS